jgi:hypothetical protein
VSRLLWSQAVILPVGATAIAAVRNRFARGAGAFHSGTSSNSAVRKLILQFDGDASTRNHWSAKRALSQTSRRRRVGLDRNSKSFTRAVQLKSTPFSRRLQRRNLTDCSSPLTRSSRATEASSSSSLPSTRYRRCILIAHGLSAALAALAATPLATITATSCRTKSPANPGRRSDAARPRRRGDRVM